MLFKYIPLDDGKTERLACPKCINALLIVDYGPLKKPKSKKNKMGFFGTCSVCKYKTRITSGTPTNDDFHPEAKGLQSARNDFRLGSKPLQITLETR
jgi:hypothetical protein